MRVPKLPSDNMADKDNHELICKNLKKIIDHKDNAIKISKESIPIFIQKDVEEYNSAYPGKDIPDYKKLSLPTRVEVDNLKKMIETDKFHIDIIKKMRNGMFCE